MPWKTILSLLVLISGNVVAAPVKVVTSTTDLAWAVKEVGLDLVEVTPLLKGTENPHYVDAVPEFIRLASEAQVVVIVGLDLEVGWMPKVLGRSGNAAVQPGGQGYVEAGQGIQVLDKKTGTVDRTMGDVHPAGNPHFWLSPRALAQSMEPVVKALSAVDPANSSKYQENLKKFAAKMQALHEKNIKRLKPLLAGTSGPVLIEYHSEFAYFLESYGLKSLGSIEEKPGVTPSAGRLAEVGTQAKNSKIKFALSSDTAPKKTLERFSEISGLRVMAVPLSLCPKSGLTDYSQLQEKIVEAVVKGLTIDKT